MAGAKGNPLAALTEVVKGDLTVYGVIRTLDLRSSGGALRVKVKQSALGKLLDRRFASRALKLDVESRELSTIWQVEDGAGKPVVEVVHRFPYNTPFAEGSPSGRGFELRGPKGVVVAYTDQLGRFFGTTLVVHDDAGKARLQVRASGFRARLTFSRPDGEALLDLVRGSHPGERWRALWMKKGLTTPDRQALGTALVLALLWV